MLDEGNVVEIGTPIELLGKGGVFCEMCRESGEFEELLAMAKAKAKK